MNLKFFQDRWYDFRIGHSTYFVFLIGFVNFVLISYNMFFRNLYPHLSLFQFCLAFGLMYVPTSIIIGYIHITRQMRYDSGRVYQQNPVIVEMKKEIEEINNKLDRLLL